MLRRWNASVRLTGCHNSEGFTLVEVGGILVGMDMIRAAQMRKLGTEPEAFRMAANTFKIKFNCMPGDCPNATDFFGTAPEGCPPGLRLGHTQKYATCNGNGNGLLDWTTDEMLCWQHLAAAQLLPGLFSGTLTAASQYQSGLNCYPVLGDKQYCWEAVQNDAGINQAIPGSAVGQNHNSNMLMMLENTCCPGFITPLEAQNYDLKFDDGGVVTGKVQGVSSNYTAGTCVTPQNITGKYAVTNNARDCALWMEARF
jgi:hypothetical protein